MSARAAGPLAALVLLLSLPAAAAADPAPGVCEYDGVDTVSYTWPTTHSTTELPAVQRYGAGNEEISVGLGGRDCGAATVNNTRLIQIVGTPPPSSSGDDIAIVLHNGVLEPSSDPAAGEVKVQLVNPGRQIRLRVAGSPRADHITAGAGGVNLNSDEAVKDVDVTVTGTGSYLPTTINCVEELCSPSRDPGSAGNDVISTAGGAGTGDAIPGGFARGIWILGGPGADTLTVDRYTTIVGGPGNDTMTGVSPVGTPFAESALSYVKAPGPVTVDLAAGTATGADGSDTFSGFADVTGGSFADVLLGDEGPNQLAGDHFRLPTDAGDTISGRGGPDGLSGGSGDDTLEGGAGDDNLSGDRGGDTLLGEDGNDRLMGDIGTSAPGDDAVDGGPGDDALGGGVGADTMSGGPGRDQLRFDYVTGPVTFDLAIAAAQDTGGGGVKTVAGIEDISGSSRDDTLRGDDGPNVINAGFDGVDLIEGRGGDDQLAIYSDLGGSADGGAGSDGVSGHAGADTLDGGPNGDTVTGAEGDDTLRGPADGALDTLRCGEGTDTTVHDEGLDVRTDCEGGQGTTLPPPPGPPPPAPPGPSVPGPVGGGPPALPALPKSVLRFPPAKAKSCLSRRKFNIRLREPGGVRYTRARLTLKAGKKKIDRTLTPKRVRGRLQVTVDLRGLPRGRFTVAITVTTADGRTVKGSRRYRTCAPKRKGGKPRL